MTRRRDMTHVSAAGTTLVELLVALLLGSLGLGALAMLSAGVLSTFDADPAASEQQQRARSAVDLLADDVARAGTGFVDGLDAAPGWGLPAVIPDAARAGAWPVAAQPNAIAVMTSARSEAHARLATAALAGQTDVVLIRPSYCAPSSATCRFTAGDDVIVVDEHGRFEMGVVRAVSPPLIVALAAPLAASWRAGSVMSVVTTHSYGLRADPVTGLWQLVRALGSGPANPVIDFVTRFEVQWGLEGAAPAPRLAPDGTLAGTTAGPMPPAIGTVAEAAWPPGENCVFARDGAGAAVSRLPVLGAGVVTVPLSSLTDGPWCPSPSAPIRWDADLVRVASVRMVLEVAVASAHLRLPLTPPLGGRHTPRLVPDLTITAVVRPGRRAAGG